jgi:DNA-binding transcriptional LysR family regulator
MLHQRIERIGTFFALSYTGGVDMQEAGMTARLPKPDPMVARVTMKQLRAFVAAAQLGSFTRAGEYLGISQPALTMTIRQLEEGVGVTLFDRTTRRLTLTTDGEQFLPNAERMLSEFAFVIEDLHALAERRRSRVGIASVYSVATSILPEAIIEFAAEHPAASIHMHDDNSAGVCRQVRRNEVDFGFASRPGTEAELDFTLLLRDRLGLVASDSHDLMQIDRELTWADIEQYEYLGLGASTGPWLAVTATPGVPTKVRSPRLELANIPTLEAMLERNLGVTSLPALAFPASLRRRMLRYRPLSEPIVMRDLYLVTRKGRSLSRAAQDMKARILRKIRDLGRTSELIDLAI